MDRWPAERSNQTIKETAVTRFHFESHDRLRHFALVPDSYILLTIAVQSVTAMDDGVGHRVYLLPVELAASPRARPLFFGDASRLAAESR
jgi:hypothetical protein